MQKSFLLSPRRRWLFAVGLLGSFPLLFPCQGLRAQTITAAASAGADPTAATFFTSTTYFDLEGSGTTTHAEFGVLDFSTSLLNPSGQTASGLQSNQLTLRFVESNAAFTAPSTLEFYLSTATGVSIAAGSPLRYITANGSSAGPNPYGIDPLLGALGGTGSTALFDLGTGTTATTGSTVGNGTVDTYTLTLNSGAVSAFLGELNTASSVVRLVAAVTSATPNGAATFAGVTNSTVANRPTISFTPTFSVANPLSWQGGNGGSWTPAGTTNWSSTPSSPGSTQWDNGGTATAIFANTGNTVNINGGNINAAGLEFDVTGYTINGTGAGNTLTLMGNHSMNVVNATDTATVNAPIAGTVGLNKIGAGTLVLGGTNTFSGGVTITAGTVAVSDPSNLGTNGSGVVFNGGTLAVASTLNSFGGGRAFTGAAGSLAYSGTTPLTINGDVTLTGTLALTGTGSVTLGDASGRFYDTITGINLANAVTLTSTGVLNTAAITASHASGTAVISGNVLLNGATNNINVANAAATLQITGAVGTGTYNTSGFMAGTGALVKQGLGTLDLLGDNSALTATTATSGAVRQGTASGTAPVSGGTIMVHTASGLGTGQYQFNNGTFSNASGGMLTFANGLSIGGGGGTGFGATFGGTAGSSSTFTGAVSLYNPSGTAFQHVITVNTPTSFTGVFSTATGSNNGLLLSGTSSLTLAPVAGAPNTFTEDITVSGGTTLTLATTGALGANRSLSLLSNGLLTLTLGTGAQDAINNAAFVSLASGSHVTLGGANETVGGLSLNGVTEPAGTYGAPGSGADHTFSNFTGMGVLVNLGTTAPIPEPSTWAAVLVGTAGLIGLLRKSCRVTVCRRFNSGGV